MEITALDTYLVEPRLSDGPPVGSKNWLFVRLESEDGLVGWGDCTDWGSPGPVAATVERYAEWVIGRDPMQAEAIWWDLTTASMRHSGSSTV